MTTPSLRQETAAIIELSRRVSMRHLPSAEAFLTEHGHLGAVDRLRRLGSMPGDAESCVCILHRTRKRFADNLLAGCYDCHAVIEHRPDVPRWTRKLCVFCALRRSRGDA